MSSDISALAKLAERFDQRLESIKQSSHVDFGWYPYHTLAVFPVLDRMLAGERRDLSALAGPGRVLDIGCGDGDLTFFLESLGREVTAIENPATNFNRTRGFAAVGEMLQVAAELVLQDVDALFSLAGRTYGLAFCLGVLYHLKNPFGFLETLARHVRHCVLSTRITQNTVSGKNIENDPVAYLVGPSETNNDATNYWIFSLAGFKRILERTGWDLCDYELTGTKRGSDPARPDRDQRVFCMIRSRIADAWLGADLDGGWNSMEQGSWRWTGRVFRVRFAPPEAPSAVLRLRFRNPLGPVSVRAVVAGHELPAARYEEAGEHLYEQGVPMDLTARSYVPVAFELDAARPPDHADTRELGVQVVFWDLSEADPRPLYPITLSAT